MIIAKPYGDYFQKSRTFIYPMVNLPKKSLFVPSITYLTWENNYDLNDHRLIVIYKKGIDAHKWKLFRNSVLDKNPFFETCDEPTSETYAVVIFNLKVHKISYDRVVSGKYSLIEPDVKSLILTYYGPKTGEYAYMDTFLNPMNYIKLYSELYNVSENILIKVGELCNKPDLEKERFQLQVPGKDVTDEELSRMLVWACKDG